MSRLFAQRAQRKHWQMKMVNINMTMTMTNLMPRKLMIKKAY